MGQREFAAEVAWDLPNLAPAALASSTRFVESDVAAWSNNTVRVMGCNISPAANLDLSPVALSIAVTKQRAP